MNKPFYVYVDVDETFVRNYGAKRIPIPPVIEHVKELHEQGAVMYCWSSGGAKYAEESAKEFGIEKCFLVSSLNQKSQLMIWGFTKGATSFRSAQTNAQEIQ